jgi:site-specific DNA recombinase
MNQLAKQSEKKLKGEKVEDPSKTLHIYSRVSSLAQANEGTSLDTQQQLGVKKAKQLKFGSRLWDEGGKSSHHEDINGRPVLLKLYEAMKRGEVKHLWVYDQSRLSRNDQVASIFRYECNKQGVTLVLLRSSSSVLDVAEVRRYHDLELLRSDAKIGQVVLQEKTA